MSKTRAGAKSGRVASASGIVERGRQAAQDGASDARDAAARTPCATSEFLSRFVYNTCYAVSYGVVFPAVFLAHSIPRSNAVVRGLIDGAQTAILKVEELRAAALDPPAAKAMPALAKA
jgi:hypothetical protein